MLSLAAASLKCYLKKKTLQLILAKSILCRGDNNSERKKSKRAKCNFHSPLQVKGCSLCFSALLTSKNLLHDPRKHLLQWCNKVIGFSGFLWKIVTYIKSPVPLAICIPPLLPSFNHRRWENFIHPLQDPWDGHCAGRDACETQRSLLLEQQPNTTLSVDLTQDTGARGTDC